MLNAPPDEFARQRILQDSTISVAERSGDGWMRFCALAHSSAATFVGPPVRVGSAASEAGLQLEIGNIRPINRPIIFEELRIRAMNDRIANRRRRRTSRCR
jgi:hypothetical protein